MMRRRVIVYRVGQTYGEVWERGEDGWYYKAVLVGLAITTIAAETTYHPTLKDVLGEYGAAYEVGKDPVEE